MCIGMRHIPRLSLAVSTKLQVSKILYDKVRSHRMRIRVCGEIVSMRPVIALIFAVIVGTFVAPRRGLAEVPCPWLNSATAAGVLGGDVQANVTPLTPLGDTTCDFRRTDQSTVSSLTIAVHTMASPSKDFVSYLAGCAGTKVPLKAIGNEAVQCVQNNGSGVEQIIGRVRERAFVIDLKRSSTGHRTSIASGLSEEARNVAEQVAGALF
jgi:hypothetical protein